MRPSGTAELVAALSLGIDLGFGQPMEHVLRQCLIALRLGERIGLDEEQRAVVYYTALLINVGCHSDAHEQAKWFGDDIALKVDEYDYEPRSLRGTATGMRRLGSGSPPLHRFRLAPDVRALGSPRGRRHDRPPRAMARALGEQLGRPGRADALAAAYERWDGKGWPGELAGEAIPWRRGSRSSRSSSRSRTASVVSRRRGRSPGAPRRPVRPDAL